MAIPRLRGIYYGWLVVAVTFATLLITAGVRSAPGVLIHPLEQEFGWDRASIAFAVSINLLLFGLVGPVVGRFMDRHGPRRVMLVGLTLTGLGTLATIYIESLWQLDLIWGVAVGIGTGASAGVLGATVASRWFAARRGLVMGILGAATAAGQLLFLPLLMSIIVLTGWRSAVLVLAGVLGLLVLPLVFFLMKDDPGELGLSLDGNPAPGPVSAGLASGPEAVTPLSRAFRTGDFWLLAGSFFICGATTNGLIGTHLIPHSIDHGIPEVSAAGAIGVMGFMNFIGTTASGWLSDRYDKRKLLAVYYGFRGLSLLLLPLVSDFSGLALFAIVYGLDWVATVPPTAGLVADLFGRRSVGGIFGWVFLSHQLGAAAISYLGGVVRVSLGDYTLAFVSAGLLALVAAGLALRITRPLPRRHATVQPLVSTATGA